MLWLGPWLNSAFLQTQAGIRNYQIEIESDRVAKPLAGRARPIRIIKTEKARLWLGVNSAVIFTLEPIGEFQARGDRLRRFNIRGAMTFLKTNLQRINQPLPHIGARNQSIYQNK